MASEAEKTAFDEVSALAEKLGFKDEDKKQKWIADHMTQLGWKPNTTWEPPGDDDGKGGKRNGGGWFD